MGSASTRDKMHQQVETQQSEGKLTDTMQMFQWGLAGGRPEAGNGDGRGVAAPVVVIRAPAYSAASSEAPKPPAPLIF